MKIRHRSTNEFNIIIFSTGNLDVRTRIMVFNATSNNISIMAWRSVLLMEESRVLEKTTDLPQVTDKLYGKFGSITITVEINVNQLRTIPLTNNDLNKYHDIC